VSSPSEPSQVAGAPAPDLFLFVSHVSEDHATAMEIVNELERRGVPCWIAPRNIHPGRPFDDEIAEAIDGCRAMLLVFSDRCNESEYIPREVTVAGDAGKLVIPFRIEEALPRRGLRVRLANLHWIDAFVARERAIDEVVREVARAQGMSTARSRTVQDEGPRTAASASGRDAGGATESESEKLPETSAVRAGIAAQVATVLAGAEQRLDAKAPLEQPGKAARWRPTRRAALIIGGGTLAAGGAGVAAWWRLARHEVPERPAAPGIPPEPANREVARIIGLAREAATTRPLFALLLLAEALQRSQNSLGVPTADAAQALNDQLAIVGGRALAGQPAIRVAALDISPDSSVVAVAQDRTIRIWNVRSGALIATLSPLRSPVTALRISGTGARLAMGGEDGAVRVVDWRNDGALLDIPGQNPSPVRAVEFDADGTMIVVAQSARVVRFYAIETREPLSLPRDIAQLEPSIALPRPNGREVFFGNNNGDAVIARLERHGTVLEVTATALSGRLFQGAVTAAATDREGRNLVAGSADRGVAALSWENGERRDGPRPLDGAVQRLDIAATREGAVVAALSTSGRLAVTDLERGAPVRISYLQQGKFSLAGVAPATDTVLSVTSDNVIHLTCLNGLQPTVDLRGHDAEVTVARFDAESRFVASGSRDGGIRIWSLRRIGSDTAACRELEPAETKSAASTPAISAADLLARARLAVGRNLTAQEWKRVFPDEPKRRATFADLPLDVS
jgi:hypothetical protein